MRPNVLLLSHSADHAVARVQAALIDLGCTPIPFHTDCFPLEHRLSRLPDGSLEADIGAGPQRIGPDDAAWIRRLRSGEGLPADLPEPGRRQAVEAARAMMDELLDTLPCFVLDPWPRMSRAALKPWQQEMARRAGLSLPPTLLTNDPAAAAAFLDDQRGPAITKLNVGAVVPGTTGSRGMPTTLVDERVRAHLGSLRLCPQVFQARVPKACELRVTVIGSRLFCARLDSPAIAGAEVDWRLAGLDGAHLWTAHTLPDEIAAALLRLLDLEGLQYSAADFIVTPDGEHVFLEANPAGEQAWLEERPPCFSHGRAIAEVLAGVAGARRAVL